MTALTNPFDHSSLYREIILRNNLFKFDKKDFSGKSLICVFLTRFCNVGCPFCFFKSAPAWRKQNIEDQFSDDGLERFIKFANQANLGYLLVSGGGEPLNQKKHILQLVQNVISNKIVLVTSGNWAKNYITAVTCVDDLYKSFNSRLYPTELVIRLSISKYHSIKLGIDPAINLINIFNKYYKDKRNFRLQIKTFEDDPILRQVLNNFPNSKLSDFFENFTSDSDILIKTIPKKYIITLQDGFQIKVGVSKIFQSGLRPNLNNLNSIKEGVEVFDYDLKKSECYKPGVVFNNHGPDGIDWSVSYNGNVSIWQNQIRDNDMNIYQNSYEEILKANLEDPLTYSIIDKGIIYRNNIVSEVNKKVILRASAIGLRDLVGAIIFEEKRTRLYYSIRVIQDYITDGKISKSTIKGWPKEILKLLKLKKDELIKLYHSSKLNIIEQQKRKPFVQEEWYDLLELIKLNHYDLKHKEVEEVIKYYNSYVEQKITTLNDIRPQMCGIEYRLTERLSYMKR